MVHIICEGIIPKPEVNKAMSIFAEFLFSESS